MRECKTCGEVKPLMDFYQASNGGLFRDCKPCVCARVRANRLVKIDQYTAYERGRANLPHRVEARNIYAKTDGGKAAKKRAQIKYNKTPACKESKRRFIRKNPSKRASHLIVGSALRSGKLTRQPCEVCGAEKAQAHHDDYTKPLDVRWLCTRHHAEWHRNNTPITESQGKAA